MSKKIILLALAAASLAAFALPASAMAVEEDVPVHAEEVDIGVAKNIKGVGNAVLTSSFGNVTCTASSGKATFATTTTGTFEQTFTGCVGPFGECHTEGLAEKVITTTTLEFHLLTVQDTVTGSTGPGVLVTPNAGHFATFKCVVIGTVTVGGTGLIGTITSPECGKENANATISFSSSSTAVQTHKTVVGTKQEYNLTSNLGQSSEDAEGTIELGKLAKLNCT